MRSPICWQTCSGGQRACLNRYKYLAYDLQISMALVSLAMGGGVAPAAWTWGIAIASFLLVRSVFKFGQCEE